MTRLINFCFLIVILCFSFASCSPRSRTVYLDTSQDASRNSSKKYRSHSDNKSHTDIIQVRQENKVRRESKLAQEWFLKGKDYYFDFSFVSAVEAFKEAILYEKSSVLKCRDYIFLGASYFYLNDLYSASANFSNAKRITLSVTPSSSEFAWEIIKAYEDAP